MCLHRPRSSLLLWLRFDNSTSKFQFVSHFTPFETATTQPATLTFGLGIDGISLFFIILTCFLFPACILVGWHALHSTPFVGHKGVHATSKLIKRQFYWPKMDADILCWIQECPSCQMNKASNKRPAGLLQPLPIPVRRWSDVSLDFITHLPKTRSGFTAILVVVDRLSKLVHFIPTHDTASAEQVARLFIDNIFVLHGMPERIVSDRDPRFTGTFWSSMCEIWKCQRQFSTAYHPQTDGQTERVNRTLEDMLRHWCNPDQDDWDEHLKLAEFACHNAFHASVGETPFMLTFG